MAWPQLPGQEIANRYLYRSLSQGRLSHAYLFVGPRGVGEEELAQGLVQSLLCRQPAADHTGCGICQACLSARGGTHPELTEIRPAGQSIGIAQVRELKTRAWYRPGGAGRRVVLMREGETLTEEAANSILRILEEPPAFLHFVILVQQANRLPATLVSRCQVVPLRALPPDILEQKLAEEGLAPGQERVVARLAAGSLERGKELATSGGAARARDKAMDILELVTRKDGAVRWQVAQRLGEAEELSLVLEQMLLWWRDAVFCQLRVPQDNWVNIDAPERIRALAQTYSLEELAYGLESLQHATRWLQENANVKLVGDVLAARLAPSRTVSACSGGGNSAKSGRGAI